MGNLPTPATTTCDKCSARINAAGEFSHEISCPHCQASATALSYFERIGRSELFKIYCDANDQVTIVGDQKAFEHAVKKAYP